MSILLIVLAMIVAASISAESFAKSKKELPAYTVEGLKLVPDAKDIAIVYAEPGATLEQDKRVYLAEPYVAFKKNWQRDQNRGRLKISSSDMERIKKEVKELFMELFTEELEKGGYQLAWAETLRKALDEAHSATAKKEE